MRGASCTFCNYRYVNWNNGIQTNGTDQHCLIKWDPDGTNGAFVDLGGTELCNGTPHGTYSAF
jgi:hypothetical protein